jgi:hypothetical protein
LGNLVWVLRAVLQCVSDTRVGSRQLDIDAARDTTVADRGLLVPLGLPNLSVELPQLEIKKDKGNQDSKAANKAAKRREI